MGWRRTLALGSVAATAGIGAYDMVQRKHAVLRNYPVVGHLRYMLEKVGPELRQYIVTNDTEEMPFNRDQRRWVYASAKGANNSFGFGTVQDLERSPNYLIIKHASFPLSSPHSGDPDFDPHHPLPVAKVLGAARGRRHAFRPTSAVNVSGMSFGSLSGNAVTALNRGALQAGCLQNTGEGGVSSYHQQGAELIWQLGSGYFGARDNRGRFDMERVKDTVAENPIRAIELKLSQGAKPGLGGMLPAAKVTDEISKIRGVPAGEDCISPPAHPEFDDVDSMLDFVERIASETGLPVGIKSAVGEQDFWIELADRMTLEDRGVDFITIDGGEGGTGAAPLVFADQVALPFKLGFSRVYAEFAKRELSDHLAFIGSGKLGFPEESLLAFGLGCDMVNVGREAMFAVGCIQAQRCHTGNCPTGVATQSPWFTRGLDPDDKAARLSNYIVTLRRELLSLSHACGVAGPADLSLDDFEIVDDNFGARSAREVFGYQPGWGIPSDRSADIATAAD